MTYGADVFNDKVKTFDSRGNSNITTPSGERTVGGGFVQLKSNYASWLEVIGALRYDPGNGENRAIVTNPITFTGPSGLHVDGSGNQLELTGPLSGNASWTKSGGGTLRLLSNSPAYLAPVVVENGTLDLDARIGSPLQ